MILKETCLFYHHLKDHIATLLLSYYCEHWQTKFKWTGVTWREYHNGMPYDEPIVKVKRFLKDPIVLGHNIQSDESIPINSIAHCVYDTARVWGPKWPSHDQEKDEVTLLSSSWTISENSTQPWPQPIFQTKIKWSPGRCPITRGQFFSTWKWLFDISEKEKYFYGIERINTIFSSSPN